MLLVNLLLPFTFASAKQYTLQDSIARRNLFLKKFPQFKIPQVGGQRLAAIRPPPKNKLERKIKHSQTRYTESAYSAWF